MSAPMSFAVVERVCNREQTGDARRRRQPHGRARASRRLRSLTLCSLTFPGPGDRRCARGRPPAQPGPASGPPPPAPRLAVAPAPATPGHTAFTFSSLKGPSSYQSRTRSHKTAGAAQQPLRRPHGVARTKSRVARRLATDKFTTLAQPLQRNARRHLSRRCLTHRQRLAWPYDSGSTHALHPRPLRTPPCGAPMDDPHDGQYRRLRGMLAPPPSSDRDQ